MSAAVTAAARGSAAVPSIDLERFRLRALVEPWAKAGELEVVEERIDLVDLGARLDSNPKAVLFRAAGPEKAEVVGNVMGSRRRLALSMGLSEKELRAETTRRLAMEIAPVEVSSSQAPVHQVVLTGADADFTRLPVHLQHSEDGGPYISAGIDVTRSLDGTKRNVGYRRMMLRGRSEAGIDLIAPSDLRALYAEYVKRKERMPVAFVVGSHPADGVAATTMSTVADEIALMGGLRGAPVPLVRCATIDAMVPADAEIVLEGYLHEHGWTESGGAVRRICRILRAGEDQSGLSSDRHHDALRRRVPDCDDRRPLAGQYRYGATVRTAYRSGGVGSVRTAIREPVAIYATPSCGGMYNLRLSLRQRYPGEVRNAISAVFGSDADVKHVFAVDDDIDVFSDAQMDWAFATRFQADRDLVVASRFSRDTARSVAAGQPDRRQGRLRPDVPLSVGRGKRNTAFRSRRRSDPRAI